MMIRIKTNFGDWKLMNSLSLTAVALILLCMGFFPVSAQIGIKSERLRVSDNHRFLVYEDGTPFFWLGDTAWELFHRLDNKQADQYLTTRFKQGFNVIQAVILAELDGLHDPAPYGNVPLKNDDPTQPNESYFKHVDYVIDKAASLGMFIALLPTWGDKVFKNSWGKGPEIFDTANARVYGEYLGRRYRSQWNIIWILGGDRNPRNEHDVAIWRSLAKGIITGIGNKDSALMSYHPQPHSPGGSSAWFHQDEWLDFNMNQTGHCVNRSIYDKISYDYNLLPVKPTIDGEPLYEDHPICFDAKKYGFSGADDIRKNFYWDLFAGAFGVTYGCHDIWQMYAPGRTPVNGARRYWYDALHLPGAEQMKYVKKLMLSHPFLTRIPDQSLIVGTQIKDSAYVSGTRASDGSYAFVYTPTGKELDINTSALNGSRIQVSWYNPREGKFSHKKKIKKRPQMHFTPPANQDGKDWILVLDALK